MKSTLKKELKAREIVKREPIEGSSASPALTPALVCAAAGNSASDPAAEPGRGPEALAGVWAGQHRLATGRAGAREGNRPRAALQTAPLTRLRADRGNRSAGH